MKYNGAITFVLCECCFDIILEDDAEYHHDKSYCHRCLKEISLESEQMPQRYSQSLKTGCNGYF